MESGPQTSVYSRCFHTWPDMLCFVVEFVSFSMALGWLEEKQGCLRVSLINDLDVFLGLVLAGAVC